MRNIPDPSTWSRPRRKRRWPVVTLFLASLVLCLLFVLGGRIKRGLLDVARAFAPEPEVRVEEKIVYQDRIVEKVVEKEKIVEVPVSEPMPERFVPYKSIDFAELYNGFRIRTEMEAEQGERASLERESEESCLIEFQLKIRVPEPNETLADLARLNRHLPAVLPALESMIPEGRVSPFYHHLYELKTERMKANLTRLNRILSRHNYYDCDTVMELQHPDSGQRVLLIQGDMDVVSDGSDGDRMPEYDEYIAQSQHYQPFTSYGWAKQSDQPNPLLKVWTDRLAANEAALKDPDVSASRKQYIRSVIAGEIKPGIADMKRRSFLIARIDPFMVIPLSFLKRQHQTPFGPQIGDYAMVIYEDRIYPAILGDAGPSFKVGEASLRIAKEIDERSSPYRRPVSDLTVTYVVFPQSRDTPFAAPDLDKWRARCQELADRVGGLGEGFSLHRWEELTPKKDVEEPEEDRGGLDADLDSSAEADEDA